MSVGGATVNHFLMQRQKLPELITFLLVGISLHTQRVSCLEFHELSNGTKISEIGRKIKKLWAKVDFHKKSILYRKQLSTNQNDQFVLFLVLTQKWQKSSRELQVSLV